MADPDQVPQNAAYDKGPHSPNSFWTHQQAVKWTFSLELPKLFIFLFVYFVFKGFSFPSSRQEDISGRYFPTSPRKHMLWVLIQSASLRRF